MTTLAGRRPLAINALEDELEEAADRCRAEGVGIELTAFAFPAGLDQGLDVRVARHRTATAGAAPISVHGPFLDLYPASPDPEVVALCRRRHVAALDASRRVGATIYVAHLNYVPLIRNQTYRERFAEATAEFWAPLADMARQDGITIVLENLWEPGPEVQRAVVDQAEHPSLKASFDNGHALVFSSRPATDWVEVLGPDLHHCHLHDNHGDLDEHLPVGQGKEDWPALVAALERAAPNVTVVIESDRLERNAASVSAFRAFNYR